SRLHQGGMRSGLRGPGDVLPPLPGTAAGPRVHGRRPARPSGGHGAGRYRARHGDLREGGSTVTSPQSTRLGLTSAGRPVLVDEGGRPIPDNTLVHTSTAELAVRRARAVIPQGGLSHRPGCLL